MHRQCDSFIWIAQLGPRTLGERGRHYAGEVLRTEWRCVWRAHGVVEFSIVGVK